MKFSPCDYIVCTAHIVMDGTVLVHYGSKWFVHDSLKSFRISSVTDSTLLNLSLAYESHFELVNQSLKKSMTRFDYNKLKKMTPDLSGNNFMVVKKHTWTAGLVDSTFEECKKYVMDKTDGGEYFIVKVVAESKTEKTFKTF